MSSRRTVLYLTAVVLLLIGLTAGAEAKGAWKLLGSRTVADRIDHDTIVVTAREGNFTAVQVRVRKIAVQFRSMTIHFANGGKQAVELRNVIPAGGSSRVIDIQGGDRVISRVDFVYDAQSFRGRRAIVRLYGRR